MMRRSLSLQHASFNFSGLLNSFNNLICRLQWERRRSPCPIYRAPSAPLPLFSFILITLNIFPRFFLLWTCAVERQAWPRFWFIHEVQWGRPLMSMNNLKATLFWIIPHFGKYVPALPKQVWIVVLVHGTRTPGRIQGAQVIWRPRAVLQPCLVFLTCVFFKLML